MSATPESDDFFNKDEIFICTEGIEDEIDCELFLSRSYFLCNVDPLILIIKLQLERR